MKLLDFVINELGKVDLNNCMVIACQHILETNLSLFEELIKLGLRPNETFLMGKAYSTNDEVLSGFVKLGINVDKSSNKFDSHKTFDEQFEINIKKFLSGIIKKKDLSKYSKIIILDDGGYLIHSANLLLKGFDNVLGVEQTSSGFHKLKDNKISFPVLNVARSGLKLNLESKFIAEYLIKNLDIKLQKFNIKPKNILVIGMGAIGKEVYNLLKERHSVSFFDIATHKSSDLEKIILNNDIIIGCTGAISVSKLMNIKHNVVLTSASSSDREFNAIEIREKFKKNSEVHRDYSFNNIILLNSGFPLNFDGGRESVPAEKIQLTRALMLSAILLGLKNNYPRGFIEIDKKIQTKIKLEFNKR